MSYNRRFFRDSFDLLIRFKAHRGNCRESTAFSLFCHMLIWEEFCNRFDESLSSNEKVSWAARLMSRPELLFQWNSRLESLDSQLVHSQSDQEIISNLVTAIQQCGLPHCKIVAARLRTELCIVPFEAPLFLRFGRTILLFSSRIKDPEPEADIDSFLNVDSSLPDQLPLWVRDADVLKRFRRNTKSSEFSFSGIQPTSGAVADIPHLRGRPMSKLAASCIASEQAFKDLFKLGLLPPPVLYYRNRCIVGDSNSQLFFVPKNYKKQRSICFEPAMLAWAQRAIERTMVRDVRVATLGRSDPHNCERNRLLVRSRQMATLDLSAASDSVSSAFIDYLGPVYSRALRATRSYYCRLPDGSLHRLRKAASMGNGWTFPLECLVFSAIAEEACKQEGLAPIYSVFGDDIIVPIGAYDRCRHLLQECGFVCNEAKSFGSDYVFRESCGYDIMWFEKTPHFVTPNRISRGLIDDIITSIEHGSHTMASLIPLANSSYGTKLGLFLTQCLVKAGARIYCDFIEVHNDKNHLIEMPYLFHPSGALPSDNASTGFETPAVPRYKISDADAYPLSLLQDYTFSLEYPDGRPTYPELRRVRS